MNKEFEKYCELMVDNRIIMNSIFKLEWTMNSVSAMLMTSKNTLADADKIRECHKLFNKNTKVFSLYRQYLSAPIICKMAMSDDPLFYLEALKTVCDEIDDAKLFRSDYSIIAAMIIYENVELTEARSYINKTRMIYQKMKDEHPILTSSSDIVFAALLAVSDIDVDNLLLEMEENYKLLDGQIMFASNRELSRLLALDLGAPGQKSDRFLYMNDELKARKMNFGRGYGLNTLALLSCLDIDTEEIMRMLQEVNDYLRVQKGFHGLSMGSDERLMYAAMIVIKTVKPDDYVIDNILLYTSLSRAIAATAAAAAA